MTISGKGFFVWQVPNCDGGDPARIAARAEAARLTHVLLKIADGTWAYNIDSHGRDLLPPIISALRAKGIASWGWHYIYGNDPLGEARLAVQRTLALGLAGYVIDAEREFKLPGKATAARTYVRELRSGLGSLPIALSSYRYPSYHPEFPWTAFLEKCDFNMPQVYWEQAHNPDEQLERSVREISALTPSLPVVPTGSAYATSGWRPAASELTLFLTKAQALGLTGANFFSWDYAIKPGYIDMWDAVARFDWGAPPPPPPPPEEEITDRILAAWNTRDVATVLALYQPNAAQVSGARTIVGSSPITDWYRNFLGNLLPGGTFTLTGRSGEGNSRHFTWTATSSAGRVLDGNDTLGMRDGKIQYHYTYFTIDRT